MPNTPAGPYAPSTPTLGGVLDHAVVHQDLADDINNLSTGAAAETSQRIAGDTARQLTAEKGAANGYASLDGTGKVPTAQLPATGGGSLTALQSGLLATKVWSGSAYVWPTGTAPDASSYTNIVFIDPAGTHDPTSSTGGRTNPNDLWETGVASSGGGGSALTVKDEGTTLSAAVTSLDFTGGGIIATNTAGAVTVNVPTGGGGGPPTGAAGGSLSGSYPNPTLAADSVTATQIATNAVGSLEIANNAVTATQLADNAVTTNKIAPDTVTNNALFDMVQATIKGRAAGTGTGTVQDLTSGQATAILDTFTVANKGLVPAPGASSGQVLCDFGTWIDPTPAGSVTNSDLAVVPAGTVKGRRAATGTGAPLDLTQAELTALVNQFTTLDSGAVPVSPGGTTNFLRADGTWSAPPGGGSVAANSITNVELADVPTNTLKGRVGAGTGDPQDLNGAQACSFLPVFDGVTKGVVPASGALTTTNVLRGDATWGTPFTGLHAALLAVKVWSGSAYVWSGDGTAPDASSYTSILFVDPTGLHDPTTSTGGRSNPNDLWETGVAGSSAAGALLATKSYNPGTAASVTSTSTTHADIDAANLVITFTAPPSGSVLISLCADVNNSPGAGGTTYEWSMRSGGSVVTGSTCAILFAATNAMQARLTHRFVITGLTPSTSYTYTWAHARVFGSGTVSTNYGGTSNGSALMEVWSA